MTRPATSAMPGNEATAVVKAPLVALAEVVGLALVAAALAAGLVVVTRPPVAAGVLAAGAALAPAGATEAPAISAETVALNWPVMPARVYLAEKEVKAN